MNLFHQKLFIMHFGFFGSIQACCLRINSRYGVFGHSFARINFGSFNRFKKIDLIMGLPELN